MAGRGHFSWIETALGAGLVNVVVNAPIGWAIVPGTGLLLWGVPSISSDLVATAGGIAFGTVLLVTPQIRGRRRQGKLASPVIGDRLRASLLGWPRSTVRRAVALGLLSVVAFVPLPLLALSLSGMGSVDPLPMAIVKGSFAFVTSALITPLIVLGAMLDERPPPGGAMSWSDRQ